VKVRLALIIAAFSAMLAPAMAQDTQGLAPADEYFGHYKLSVLGIANTIRDAGARIDAGTDPRSMLNGPLSFVNDAIKDWESQYPADPWISKDLLALETVYLRVPTDEGFRLATQTESWLVADYANSDNARRRPQRVGCQPNSLYAATGSASGPSAGTSAAAVLHAAGVRCAGTAAAVGDPVLCGSVGTLCSDACAVSRRRPRVIVTGTVTKRSRAGITLK
jgi:hypothetical protein